MKKLKMSLGNIEGKLSRVEMKKIMAGSGACPSGNCTWYELLAGGRIVTHTDGTCEARTGIQVGCACNGQTDDACNW